MQVRHPKQTNRSWWIFFLRTRRVESFFVFLLVLNPSQQLLQDVLLNWNQCWIRTAEIFFKWLCKWQGHLYINSTFLCIIIHSDWQASSFVDTWVIEFLSDQMSWGREINKEARSSRSMNILTFPSFYGTRIKQ